MVAHTLERLVQRYSLQVLMNWLVEQHAKSIVDSLFGWCRGWRMAFIHKHDLLSIKDLYTCYKDGMAQMMKEDPTGVQYIVIGQQYIDLYKYIHINKYMYTYTHIHTYTYIYIYIHVHLYLYIYIYIYL